MWLQNHMWLAALVLIAGQVYAVEVTEGGEDVKHSGDVKITCIDPIAGEDTKLSLSVVEKSLNDLQPLVSAMCAGHVEAGNPSMWEAAWKDKPDLGKVSNFKAISSLDEATDPNVKVFDSNTMDFSDITADVTKMDDDKKGTDSSVQTSFGTAAAEPAEPKTQVPPEEVSVKTYLGKLRGYRNKLEDNEGYIYSFLGVPYAQPPTGSRRFKPPLPVTAYKSDEAFGFRSECPQVKAYGERRFEFIGNEDCLTLNIFSPSLTSNKDALKPVMVWFHGGAFTMGSGNEYVPVEMTKQGVLVVTVNFRLGALGYLTFGNDIVSGNMGLKDQLESLRWIKRFIHNFGGDPDKVTIFGQSSGSLMVSAMQLSPKATGLFRSAITQSGNMLMRRVTAEASDEKRTAKGLAEKVGCASDYSEAMLECMQKIPIEELIQMSSYAAPNLGAPKSERERGPWWPVVDHYATDPVLPMEPLNAIKTGMFNKVPMMSGTVTNDGAIQAMSLLRPQQAPERFWQAMAPILLMIGDSANTTETSYDDVILASMATKYYTNEDYNFDKTMQSWIDLFSDALFLSPDQKWVDIMVEQEVPVYNYRFTLKPTTSVSELFGVEDNEFTPVNGEDILMLFDQFSSLYLEEDQETKIGDMMIEYWTNFAKYGNPSPFDKGALPNWKQVTEQKEYLEISKTPEMKYNIHPERITFWQKMLWDRKEDHIDRMMLYGKLSKLFMMSNNMMDNNNNNNWISDNSRNNYNLNRPSKTDDEYSNRFNY